MSSSRVGWGQGWRILRQLSAVGTRAAHPLILPAPLPSFNPQFQPSRLQEGIRLGPFDAADEKWCKKAPWRCPAGSRPSGLQRLYAHHSLVTRLVACLAYALPPRPISPTLPPVLFTLGMSRGNIYTQSHSVVCLCVHRILLACIV